MDSNSSEDTSLQKKHITRTQLVLLVSLFFIFLRKINSGAALFLQSSSDYIIAETASPFGIQI
jgi:hypothetical protein